MYDPSPILSLTMPAERILSDGRHYSCMIYIMWASRIIGFVIVAVAGLSE